MGILRNNQKAFTIIEVILFLAISAGMLFVALNAISGRSEEVRFQQSMRAVEAYVQLIQNNVQDGVVLDSANVTCQGGGSECVVLGRAVEFTPGSSNITVHVITGNRLDPTDTEPAVTLGDARPFVSSANVETNSIDWQSQFLSGEFPNNPAPIRSDRHRVIGYIRLPNGTEIVPIGFSVGPGDAVAALGKDCLYDSSVTCSTGPGISTIDGAFSAELCFADAGRSKFARLVLGGDERRQAIRLDFDESISCA